jgi:hypothetical protein
MYWTLAANVIYPDDYSYVFNYEQYQEVRTESW